jgi:hypothetical protein
VSGGSIPKRTKKKEQPKHQAMERSKGPGLGGGKNWRKLSVEPHVLAFLFFSISFICNAQSFNLIIPTGVICFPVILLRNEILPN